MKTLPRHGDGVGLQIFYIFSPPCIQPGGAGAGAVDDVLITRGAVTSELRSSHVSDDNLRRPRGHYLWRGLVFVERLYLLPLFAFSY